MFITSITELRRISITSNFEEADAELILFNLDNNIFNLYEMFGLNMTLKIHILIHHYRWYFTKTGNKFKDTNGEFGETVHSTVKKFELGREFKVSRKLETDHHLLKAHQSILTCNALKMRGKPPNKMGKRRKTSSTTWAFRRVLFTLFIMVYPHYLNKHLKLIMYLCLTPLINGWTF